MNDFSNAYAPIVKYDKNGDGTLMVYGKATDDSLDIDQQICDAGWLDRAMPEWFKSGGNIREQHSSIAAGVAKEYEAKEDGHYITTLVVDPISVKKVETGVLKGFSIGIKSPRVVRDTKAVNGRIIDGQIVEVSLVDRPANPNAKLIMAKSVDGESSLVQVEELQEFSAPLPSQIFKKETDYEAINQGGGKSEPADKDLYNRVKAEAKDKFDVYPSAVANAWIVREYKKRGGTYKKEKASALIEIAKSIAPTIKKFDDVAFSAARDALAQLVIAEATEMKDGEDESASLSILLNAIQALFQFHAHEAAEGETIMEDESMELAAKEADVACACKCAKCAEAKGCDSKECSCKESMAKDSHEMEHDGAEKSVHKCLECGCGVTTDSHGKDRVVIPGGQVANVSTSATMDVSGSIKSVEGEAVEEVLPETPADETPAEVPAEEIKADEEVSTATADEVVAEEKSVFADSQISDILEKAVKSAKESVQAEIDLIKSANEAAEKKIADLEAELAVAVTKAVAGGPKRSTAKSGSADQTNILLAKAEDYSRKAATTTDPELAVGYRSLAKEFFAKAGSPIETE